MFKQILLIETDFTHKSALQILNYITYNKKGV